MTKLEAIKRLGTIVKHSTNSNYHYEVKANDWQKIDDKNGGAILKHRTYFSIVETREHSKHHAEREYGYMDMLTGEYYPGKNDLRENYTFSGMRFDESASVDTEEPRRFKDKYEFDKWINGHQTSSIEAIINGFQDPSDDEYIALLQAEGYTDLDNLVENGDPYSFCGHTNRARRWIIEEYRDKAGVGSTRVFDNQHEALETAMNEWDALSDKDKKSYGTDPAGMFRLFRISIPPQKLEQYEDGELDGTLADYETGEIWNALQEVHNDK